MYNNTIFGRENHRSSSTKRRSPRKPWLAGIAFFGPAICMILNATIGPSLGVVAQAMQQWDHWGVWNIIVSVVRMA